MPKTYVVGPRKQATVRHDHQWTRTTAKQPCTICGKPDWCSLCDCGAAHCMREESAIPVGSGGWIHTDNAPAPDRVTQAEHTTATKSAAPLAPAEIRDRIYTDLLAACGLSAQHDAWLLTQGIDTKARLSYGTLNGRRGAALKYLQERYSSDQLRGTPGLWIDEEGNLRLAAADGLLLAVRDSTGRIARMQCRVEHGGSKSYPWLSSSKYDGPSSGAIAHVAHGKRDNYIYITEGVKKAEVLAARTGYTAIGLPGHGNMASGLAVLDELIAAGGGPGVIIALDEDSDPATAALVDKSRNVWIAEGHKRELLVKVERWQDSGKKGIDDLLLAGMQPKRTLWIPQSPRPDPSTGTLQDDLVKALASPLPENEKIAVMALRVTEATPGVIRATKLETVVAAAGRQYLKTGKTKTGKDLADCAARGVVYRDLVFDKDRRTSVLHLASRLESLPQQGAIVQQSPHKATDTKRKRKCRSCGQESMVALCLTCGNIEPLDPSDPTDLAEDFVDSTKSSAAPPPPAQSRQAPEYTFPCKGGSDMHTTAERDRWLEDGDPDAF